MPYVLDENGLQIPTRPELLGEIFADYQSPDEAIGYGPDADVSQLSPIYRIAQRVSGQIAVAWQGLRDFTGQLDPDNAVGQQLDRLGSLINNRRRGRTRSTIIGRVIGVPGVTLGSGGRVRYKPLGTLWDVPAGSVIPVNGVLVVEATSADFGPIDAAAGGAADWEIVAGQVDGWTSFDSQGPATLGALAAEDPEYRPTFKNAAKGYATYDAIVREVRAVANVTNVYLYVNAKLAADPVTGLLGKQMRFIVQGGARLDIAAAIHRSVGAPVDTVGAVVSTIEPGNGQALTYRFDRLTRRRGYLRLTYTGGNPIVPLPDNAAALVLAAVDQTSSPGQAFNPMVYGTAGLLAILTAKPGSVTKVTAEARLDPFDPWVEDAIVLPLDQEIEVATGPVAAVAYSVAEDPIAIAGLADIFIQVNGNAAVQVTFPPLPTSGSAAIAAVIQAAFDPLVFRVDSDSGRVRFQTTLKGSIASIGFPAGSAAIALGVELKLFKGSDGDVEVVVIP